LFPLFRASGSESFLGEIRAAWQPFFWSPYQALFAGGMVLAAAIEAQGLHHRLALNVLVWMGAGPRRLLAGVLGVTALVSLWISNTATAAMMLPIALALVGRLESREDRSLGRYATALLLAVAWGANVGGMGTKIGTAPNSQLSGFLERGGFTISFLEFSAVGLPFVCALLPIAWSLLWWMGHRDARHAGAREEVAQELAALGRTGSGERRVAWLFVGTAGAWVGAPWAVPPLRRLIPDLGSAELEGALALTAGTLALLMPSGNGRPLLTLSELRRVRWSTLLLLGGGFSLAAAVERSGLSKELSRVLQGLSDLTPLLQTGLAALASVLLSAVASNTATTAVLLVVLSQAIGPETRLPALFAATLAASCDFALPVGTPPNALVFASGRVRIPVMARYGFGLDLIAAGLAAAWCSWVVARLWPPTAFIPP
jgi:sodium-dependent dicarboxylate transporter 2/3/5